MVQYITTILLLFVLPIFGQVKRCFCEKDTLMNEATIACDTTIFSNKSKLFWQFNCDSIWLTLENVKRQKIVIDKVPVELYGYTYRIGYQLIKEFKKFLLFRSGCSANGPCIYTLVDKNNGAKIKEFDQLICIDTDIENPHKYNFDFIVYLSDTTDSLIIYYVESNKTIQVPFVDILSSRIPQYQFEEMTLDNNILILTYKLENGIKKSLKVNLSGNI